MQKKIAGSHEQKKPEELTASELVRKHIQDPNHVITDEEFRNVKLELDPPSLEGEDEEGTVDKTDQ